MIKETILAQIPEGVTKCLIVSEGSTRFFPAVPFFDYAHIAARLRRTLLSAISTGARCFLVMDPFEVFTFVMAEILCEHLCDEAMARDGVNLGNRMICCVFPDGSPAGFACRWFSN